MLHMTSSWSLLVGTARWRTLACRGQALPSRNLMSAQEILGVADRIASVNSYVVSPCGQQALACGKCALCAVLSQKDGGRS